MSRIRFTSIVVSGMKAAANTLHRCLQHATLQLWVLQGPGSDEHVHLSNIQMSPAARAQGPVGSGTSPSFVHRLPDAQKLLHVYGYNHQEHPLANDAGVQNAVRALLVTIWATRRQNYAQPSYFHITEQVLPFSWIQRFSWLCRCTSSRHRQWQVSG